MLCHHDEVTAQPFRESWVLSLSPSYGSSLPRLYPPSELFRHRNPRIPAQVTHVVQQSHVGLPSQTMIKGYLWKAQLKFISKGPSLYPALILDHPDIYCSLCMPVPLNHRLGQFPDCRRIYLSRVAASKNRDGKGLQDTP